MDRNKRWKLTEAERKTVEVWKRFIVISIVILLTEIVCIPTYLCTFIIIGSCSWHISVQSSRADWDRPGSSGLAAAWSPGRMSWRRLCEECSRWRLVSWPRGPSCSSPWCLARSDMESFTPSFTVSSGAWLLPWLWDCRSCCSQDLQMLWGVQGWSGGSRTSSLLQPQLSPTPGAPSPCWPGSPPSCPSLRSDGCNQRCRWTRSPAPGWCSLSASWCC